MNHRVETQRFFQNREKLIALARICDIDRFELIQLNEYMDESIFLVLGGDYSQFFQYLNSTPILLRNNPTLAQKIDVARRCNSTVIYQKM